MKWEWTDHHQAKFGELKKKLSDVKCLGVPRASGEILVVTDASDLGGGASIYQWQSLSKEEKKAIGETLGVNRDGCLKHTHEGQALVPLGYWNWKWNPTRQGYATYEKELLAGILTLGSQRRIVAHLPIVWLCDQEAVSQFTKGGPPEKARQRRWWTFLSQFQLNFYHIPGIKNELCDMLPRDHFCERFEVEFEELAKQAFQRMDSALDLRLEVLRVLESLTVEDYEEEFKEEMNQLELGKPKLIEGRMFYREPDKLWCEKKLILPKKKLEEGIRWSHQINGHPGVNRTMWFLLSQFQIFVPIGELRCKISEVLSSCRTCTEAKPNTPADRGLVGALPIPKMINEILYIDFTCVDEYAGHDYVMTVVDGLSRYAQFIPCKKKLDGEGAFQLLWQHWIQKYGKPREIHTDNDVRFSSRTGFWQTILRSLGVRLSFSQPRRPQGNGICERMNRTFKQNMRVLMAGRRDKNWLRVVPYATWIINSQVHMQTGVTPAELFLGRPAWTPDLVPDPDAQPSVKDWMESQLELRKKAQERLQEVRQRYLEKVNQRRRPAVYQEGDWVLVHKRRFPQWTTTVFGSQWFGPYRIIKIQANSVKIRASPKLGGEVEVAHEHLKRYPVHYDEGETEEEDEDEAVLEDEREGPKPEEEEKEEMTKDEAEAQGFFNVDSIVKHKYRKGWYFLTVWEGWPVSDATWEPVKAFVQPDGRINTKFQEYCQAKSPERPLREAIRRANRTQGPEA